MPPTRSRPTLARIERCDPRGREATVLPEILPQTLSRLTGASGEASFDLADVEAPGSLFVIAYDPAGRPIGCGSYRRHSDDEAEIKRMLALPGTRGAGSALLAALELSAQKDGYRTAILETRKVNERAVTFYARHGYAVIPNYGRYKGRDEAICFAKRLG